MSPTEEHKKKIADSVRRRWDENHDEWAARVRAGQRRAKNPRAVILAEENPLDVFDSDEFGA
jgi:hypothetical protein